MLIDPYRYEDSGPSIENGNWGAELQNLNFWTVTAGNPQVRANQSERHAPEGVAIFDGGSSGTSRMEQAIELATVDGLSLSDVDDGLIFVNALWWGGSFIQAVLDQPSLYLRFEDASNVVLARHNSGRKTPTLTVGGMRWNEYHNWTNVPPNTRFVVVECEMLRNTGTNNDAAHDDIRITFGLGDSGPVVTATVATLLHLDGSDGSTTITCEAGLNYTVAGNAQLDTAMPRYSSASLLLDGNGDRITSDASANLKLDNSDWTMELYFRVASYTNTTQHIWQIGSALSQRLMLYFPSGSDNLTVLSITSGNPNQTIDCGFRPTIGEWYHFALVHDGTQLEAFINGTSVGTISVATLPNSATPTLCLGFQQFSGVTADHFAGWIDEVRFVREALYTSNFSQLSLPFVDP